MKNIPTCLLILTLLLTFSCKDKFDEEEQFQKDLDLIEAHLAENNLTAQKTASGLHYIIQEEGTGNDHPDINSTVECIYSGFLMEDGSFFDGSLGQPATFSLTNVIEGWQEGIPKFKRNGSGYLFIPSKLAYGNTQRNGIPKNSVLIFEIELVHFW